MKQAKRQFYAHKKNKQPAAAVPVAPNPANEYFYDGNQLVSQRAWDGASNSFINRTFLSPQEEALKQKAQAGYTGTLGQIDTFINDPNAYADRINQFAAPQLSALDDAYNESLATANTNAAASGLGNSVGFEAFKANQLDRNRARDKADILGGAQQGFLSQLQGLAGLYGGALDNSQGSVAQAQSSLLSGAGLGANQQNQNYQMRLQQFQATPQQKIKGRTFFDKVFNPFGV